MKNDVYDFRKIVYGLLQQGMKKTAIMKDSQITYNPFERIMNESAANYPRFQSATKHRIKNFIMKHQQLLLQVDPELKDKMEEVEPELPKPESEMLEIKPDDETVSAGNYTIDLAKAYIEEQDKYWKLLRELEGELPEHMSMTLTINGKHHRPQSLSDSLRSFHKSGSKAQSG